jgi:energy-coupling factor transport system permease protein
MTLLAYSVGNSFFHRMDPSVKFIWAFVVCFTAFAVTNVYALATLLLSELLVIRFLAGVSLRTLGRNSFIAFGPAVGFFVIYSFLYPSPRTVLLDLSVVKLSMEGMAYGAAIALRFPIMVLTAIVFMLTTDQKKFVLSAIQVLRVPISIAYMEMLALRMAPLVEEELGNIVEAHAVRGMDLYAKGFRKKLERYRLILIPLFVRVVKTIGEQMAVTLESRAFGAYDRMTFMERLRPSKKDIAFLLAWVGVFLLFIFTGYGDLGQYLNSFVPAR